MKDIQGSKFMTYFEYINQQNINKGVEKFINTENAMLLDVRTEEEFQEGHIEHSVNIPLHNISKVSTIVHDKYTSIFVYCLSGARSEETVSILESMGYVNVINIGGISSYKGKVVKE